MIYEVFRFPESADATGGRERIPLGVFLEAESRNERTAAAFGVLRSRSGVFTGFRPFEDPWDELLEESTLGVLRVKPPTLEERTAVLPKLYLQGFTPEDLKPIIDELRELRAKAQSRDANGSGQA